MFQPIDAAPFETPKDNGAYTPGPAPTLLWLKIADLVVDHTYQREIGKKGRQNIRLIAERFEWPKFAPVIVAAVEGGKYTIVDGQHRTTAAAVRGFESVPCQMIQADRLQQAQAFAAVNGQITKLTPQQMYRAKLAAKDDLVSEVNEACKIAGVFITRHNRGAAHYQVGETQAIGAITRAYQKFGRETLITALQCITQTGDGNVGWIRSTIVEALCAVLNHRHDWREAGDALLRAMDDFSFVDEWDRASEGRENIILSRAVSKVFYDRINEHLAVRLKTSLQARYVEEGEAKRGKARSSIAKAA